MAKKPSSKAKKTTAPKKAKGKTASLKIAAPKSAKKKVSTMQKPASRPAKAVKATSTVKVSRPEPKKNIVAQSKTGAAVTSTPPVQQGGKNRKLSPRDKKIQEIRQKLIFQKTSLLSEAETALNALPGQTIFPDLGDQASAEIDRNFMLRLRGREQRLIKKIEEAIEKIDTGVFGICDSCGQEIDIKRLEARPVTTMCIFCKTEQEEEERVRGV